MLRLPPQLVSQQDDVESIHLVVLANQKSGLNNCSNLTLLRDKFVRWWKNAQHRFSNCFAAMLRDELGDFVDRITMPLGTVATDKSV